MISELCVELVQAIASEVSPPDQKALRAVSRQLRRAIEPLLCASVTLVLDLNNPRRDSLTQLKTLTESTTAWSYCQRLRIVSLRGRVRDADNESMQELLRPALESLTGLRALEWDLNDDEPSRAHDVVVEVMNAHEHMDELRLVDHMVHGHRFIDLAPVSNLRVLSASARGGGWTCPAMDWLSLVVRKSPDLEGFQCPSSDTCPELYTVMQQEGIRLKQVKVRATDSVLLRYLASYSGLERLEISAVRDDDDWNTLFGTVLPRHTATLVVLRCPGFAEGVCSFKVDNIALISQMQRLQTLEMSINGSAMWDQPEKGLRNIVDVFLEMAMEMPLLRNIAILAAIDPWNGRCSRGPSKASLREGTQKRIAEAVDAFGRARGTARIARLIETHHRRISEVQSERKLEASGTGRRNVA
ncbi:hypothetical protein DFH06DRAFT_1329864 [Mycena polygramma]|nr:hypothetical protein DFH06DRAFT_1329864 [Mycena polygramma]